MSGLELADIELKRIVKDLADSVVGYYVNNVYSVDPSSILIRLGHSTKPTEKLVISAGKGIWKTSLDLQQEGLSSLVQALRKEITRLRVEAVHQTKGERIATITLTGAEKRLLVGEFFGEGNIILTDEERRIITLLKPLKVRHRELRPGATYTLPPRRALCVEDLSQSDLAPLTGSNLPVPRWLGRQFALPRKYVHEVLRRSNIAPQTVGQQLKEEDLPKIYACIHNIVVLAESAPAPTILMEGDKIVGFAPFLLEDRGDLTAKPAESFMEVVDQAFSQEIIGQRRMGAEEPLRSKIEELKHSSEEQAKSLNELKQAAKSLRSLAAGIVRLSSQSPEADTKDLVDSASEGKAQFLVLARDRALLTLEGVQIELAEDVSPPAFASRIFAEAKNVEKKAEQVRVAHGSLQREIEALQAKLQARSQLAVRETPTAPRRKNWFERYRWFRTSENLLAVGGRDSASNSAIIRKHLDERDTVFHTDIVGSPFFILKDGSTAGETSVQEAAHAVAGFSRAWTSGLSSADAYWVNATQVKLAAPSGMYLPRGSFLIEGEKHMVKGLPIAVALGVMFQAGAPVVFGGAPTAVEKWSHAFAVLAPERVKATDTAKQVKAQLVALAEGEEAERLKRLSVDEFLRAMPPGGGRIVRKGSGKQKH